MMGDHEVDEKMINIGEDVEMSSKTPQTEKAGVTPNFLPCWKFDFLFLFVFCFLPHANYVSWTQKLQ